jgi:fucose 4-O-acetylase-like acetyltransferase
MTDNSTQVADADGDDRTAGLSMESQPSRFLDIDRLKGFAIALVVWGHTPSAAIETSQIWYYISISVIYSFHMPLFMYLSGFVYFYVGSPERFWKSPIQQIASRFNRLMVPFMALGLVIIFGKYIVHSLSSVSDPVTSVSVGLFKVISNAPDNPLISIWYLFVLFIYTLITPILWRLGGRSIVLILMIGTLGWTLTLPEDYYIRRVFIYFIFFGIGGAFAIYKDIIFPILLKYAYLFLFLFVVILSNFYRHEYALILCGFSSILALHGMALQKFAKNGKLLLTLGNYSMAIYLLNTIFIGVSIIVLSRFYSGTFLSFIIVITCLFASGVAGPMVARKIVNSVPILKPVARYLD